MKEKHIVSFRDVDRPIGEYPKGTFFAQDHDDIVIPMPTKEELEEYKRNMIPPVSNGRWYFICCDIATEREDKNEIQKETSGN